MKPAASAIETVFRCVGSIVARDPIAVLSAAATWSSVSPVATRCMYRVVPTLTVQVSPPTGVPFSARLALVKVIGVTLSDWSAVVERVIVAAGCASCVIPSARRRRPERP